MLPATARAATATVSAWIGRHRGPATAALTLFLVAAGLLAAMALLRGTRPDDVRAAIATIPRWRLALAVGLTAASYAALTLYDVLALRLIGRPLPWRTAAVAAFTSYAFSHSLGLAPVTGGSARYRVYREAGLDAADVARVVAISGATLGAGLSLVTGVALAVRIAPVAIAGHDLPAGTAHLVGFAVLATLAGLIALAAGARGTPTLFGWRLPLPSAGLALAQVSAAVLDLAAAGAALFVLLPGLAPALLPSFILAYALAIVATLVAHVPGGVGVFEAVMIAALPVDRAPLVAALAAYRIVYYLLPLAAAVLLVALRDGGAATARRRTGVARRLASALSPLLMSAATAAGGAILLLSGATPGLPARLAVLQPVVPLPFIEASHFAASLVGTALLLLAHGLYRRLDGAFHATRALLVAGALFSLAKGIDYEEAVVCLAIAAMLQWTRAAFYRRTTLVAQPVSRAWLAGVAGAVTASIWLGLRSYRQVAYANDLWWHFALHGDASRYLRASLGAGVTLAGAALSRSFAPAARQPPGPLPEAVAAILARAEHTDAMLAHTGDKRFLVSDDGSAFVMYRVRGRSWIVMGDPVGERGRWAELVWTMRAMADEAQGRLMLYQISGEMLEPAIALGLDVMKYGEEAMVDLAGFSLAGKRMRSLRFAIRHAARAGSTFEVVPAAQVPALLPELAAVSDAWLEAKGRREKAFSLGRFDPAYLARFDCAVVRLEGRIVAFANLWRTDDGGELSVDLMRHTATAPGGTMDYLFAELMLWGQARGYKRFSLGLAPLAGIEGRRLAPLRSRLAAAVFRHGERFYGFRGLRAYKSKLVPTWRPRYLAGPHGAGFYLALLDLRRLIAHPPSTS